jgi:ferredoxin
MFKININNDQSFVGSEEETLFEAARSQMVKIPYACTRGGCGYCKVKVLEGKYKMDRYAKSALSDEEVNNRIVLLCKTRPLSDLHLELNQ